MTTMEATPLRTPLTSRWLLLSSLALNLFFIGIAIAMIIRGPAPAQPWDRNVFVRTERIAARLPSADGDILRQAINANRDPLENAQTTYRAAQEKAREALRREPFSGEELRAAMVQTRTARQSYDQMLQGAIAEAAAKMSPAGRQALAASSSGRGPGGR